MPVSNVFQIMPIRAHGTLGRLLGMAAFIGLLTLPCRPSHAEEATGMVSNQDEPGAVVGQRPYEMDWAGRFKPEHESLVDFEDLSGWRLRCVDGANAKGYRSRQELLFGDYPR